ncbi:hypothetical protein Srot_0065 [Segniliparus rotundus DSM 44985]|uniref:MuF-like minor capsid protein n=1 Tax=Segniliparus rotundus (strain ATCC BAA-972 / CDC 1076 / CIP 108378 / DSM 44985 / JCM 13578) TaxID=640132 RepID=D6Z9N1_SEGRD|nr:hypothetical protein [Segniliparus rotundus]ADG96558.1 hypothetical protein Srot_0065 [Segniliparus rotundus DSM 44985]
MPLASDAEQMRASLVGLSGMLEDEARSLAADDSGSLAGSAAKAWIGSRLAVGIGGLIEEYAGAAQAVAADFYDLARGALALPGRFTAFVPDPGTFGPDALTGWAASEATSFTAFESLVVGGASRRVMNAARDTTMANALADPQCRGWMRIGAGECDFCRMLIARGDVYTSESVRFKSHDHCKCQAAPVWDESNVVELREKYVPSARFKTEAARRRNNEAVRAYLSAQ